jgi:prolyl oligopeptidase PreP (S9A serine peptidase family)
VVKAGENEDFSSISGSPYRSGVFLQRSSYTQPTALSVWSGHGQPEVLNLQTHPVQIKAELDVTYESVIGHDGTKIPLAIVKHRGTRLGPQTPVVIDAYGSYANISDILSGMNSRASCS